VSKSIERAQKQVESRNFEIRKHLLEYDDVMNKQRESVYRLRRQILDGTEGRGFILRTMADIVEMLMANHCPEEADPDDWDVATLKLEAKRYFGIELDSLGIDWSLINRPQLAERLAEAVRDHYMERVERFGSDEFERLEKYILLDTVDRHWKDHLLSLDHLREGIGLRAYGQRNPLVEYKRESFDLFEAMWERIEDQVVTFLFHAEPVEQMEMRRRPVQATLNHADAAGMAASRAQQERAANTPVQAPDARPITVRRSQPKVGRNDPCPCGSGKKYKKCHGQVSDAGGAA